MPKVVGVRFKKAGKIFDFDCGDFTIHQGEEVIVDTVRGQELGLVVRATREVNEESLKKPLKPVQRIATDKDKERLAQNKKLEKEAFEICSEKITEHELSMKLLNVECTFDVSRIIFTFMSHERVDFRALVRDLAAIYHTRIEMRQVGVRDQAKSLGGVGCCGREVCCSTFLENFVPVSIHMAKTQNLSLNPTKISGICGRLLCCLQYEDELYNQEGSELYQPKSVYTPEVNDSVATEYGRGRVITTSVSKHTATILLDNKRTVVLSWDDIASLEQEAPASEDNSLIAEVDIPDESLVDTVEAIEPLPPTKNTSEKGAYKSDVAPKIEQTLSSDSHGTKEEHPHQDHKQKPHNERKGQMQKIANSKRHKNVDKANHTQSKPKHERSFSPKDAKRTHNERKQFAENKNTPPANTRSNNKNNKHKPQNKNRFFFYEEEDS